MVTWRIELPASSHGGPVTCGVVTDDDGRVTDAAPIMRWSLGVSIREVELWAHRHGGRVERLAADTPMIYAGGRLRRIGRG